MTHSYIESCRKDFWQTIFNLEVEFLSNHLPGSRNILSVGCGPATIEESLAKQGFNITGLDLSFELLQQASDTIRRVSGDAHHIPFFNETFDTVILIASIQFMEDYHRVFTEIERVLASKGRIIVLLLNLESGFFKAKMGDPHSYVHTIRHRHLAEIVHRISQGFSIQTQYILSIQPDGAVLPAGKTDTDSLILSILGTKWDQ